jgi:hypothetical protein
MLVIRESVADGVPLIAQMIREFAEYQRELDQVSATPRAGGDRHHVS